MDTIRAITGMSLVTRVDHSVPMRNRPSMAVARVSPAMTPMMPPPKVRNTASVTNWATMSRRLAPMACRMPISRVRSVTETSMMFMIPMPPTSREMPATVPRNTTRVWLASSKVSRISCWLKTVKSSASVMRWLKRRTVSISSMAWSTDSTSLAWIEI